MTSDGNKIGLYQIRDLVGELAMGPIMQVRHVAVAMRHFHDILADKDPQNIVAKHPDDFALVHLGAQDEQTGEIEPHSPPRIVGTGRDWRDTQDKNTPRQLSLQDLASTNAGIPSR